MTHIEADPTLPIIRITREFQATAARLLRAHTDPELFARWIGPDRMQTRIEHWDARTGGSFRFFSVGDRFPAMWLVDQEGVSVPGELYDVPLTTIRDRFIPAEPSELDLGVIELADGESALAVVLRREFLGAPELVDISDRGGWRDYRSRENDGR